ncbi:MAG: hypothetical protein Q7S76_02720, partial [bacterium]|nr:hypothetical protein [bacterium]
EFCGGPHVGFTGVVGHFTIQKEESLGSGTRRIYAALTHEVAHTHSAPVSTEN